MSKHIDSPVKRWPGSVLLRCPVPLEPYTAWKRSIESIVASKDGSTFGDIADNPELVRLALPGIMAMVEAWDLGGDFPKNVTADTFPFIPRIPSFKLIVWLINEISQVIGEEDDLPLT